MPTFRLQLLRNQSGKATRIVVHDKKGKRVAGVSPTFANYVRISGTYSALDGFITDDDAKEWFYEQERLFEHHVGLNSAKDYIDDTFHPELWTFQRADVHAMRSSTQIINGNDRAMGKTVESLMALRALKVERVLVVCTNLAMITWEEETKRWLGEDVTLVTGSHKQRIDKIRNNKNRIMIIGYGFLRRWLPPEISHPWDVIIFDEAHRLKNRKAQQTVGAKLLTAKYKWLLTGTPIRNSPDELWSLLNLLNPLAFPHYWPFVEQFCEVWMAPWGRQIQGIKRSAQLAWFQTVGPYMISRKKKDYLHDLPAKLPEDPIYLDMTKIQRRLYDELKKEMMVEIEEYNPALETSTGPIILSPNTAVQAIRLRQITISPRLVGSNDMGVKIPAAIEVIRDHPGKVVVFTFFRASVSLLAEELDREGIESRQIVGGMSVEDLGSAVLDFRGIDTVKVLVGTIGSMSESINLQESHMVIFLDKSFVPGENEQAKDRIHRPGQQYDCVYIDLIVRKSADQRIRSALHRKQKYLNDEERIRHTFREEFLVRCNTEDG